MFDTTDIPNAKLLERKDDERLYELPLKNGGTKTMWFHVDDIEYDFEELGEVGTLVIYGDLSWIEEEDT